MTTDLHKRLEEAANEYAQYIDLDYRLATFIAFQRGAKWMYKEAIEVAKEWLRNHLGKDNGTPYFIKAFETDMNKLWEEKK